EVALGTDIDTAGGIVEQDDRCLIDETARHQGFLLVAAREAEDRGRQAGGVEREAFGPGAGMGGLGSGVNRTDSGPARGAADRDVVEHAPEREDTLGLTITRDEAGARMAGGIAGAGGAGCKEPAQQRLLAGALKPGEPDYLTGAQGDVSAARLGHRPRKAYDAVSYGGAGV